MGSADTSIANGKYEYFVMAVDGQTFISRRSSSSHRISEVLLIRVFDGFKNFLGKHLRMLTMF
jgi:hypothetical protein